MSTRRVTTSYLARTAVLSALALILMILEFPIPLMPGFLKIDFSEIPALLATFALGPLSGVAVELIKNLLHLLMTQTAGIGEMANFVVGCAMIVPAGLVYRRRKTRSGAFVALVVGIIAMCAAASIMNYFVLIPLYGLVLHFPLEAIIGMGTEANKSIVSLRTLIAYGIIPFNLIKGIGISLVMMLVYKKLSPILHVKNTSGVQMTNFKQ